MDQVQRCGRLDPFWTPVFPCRWIYFCSVEPGAKRHRDGWRCWKWKCCHEIFLHGYMQMQKDGSNLNWSHCEPPRRRISCSNCATYTSTKSGVIHGVISFYYHQCQIIILHENTISTCILYQSLHGRRLSDAPHLHPRPLLLLPAGTVGAVGGAAI